MSKITDLTEKIVELQSAVNQEQAQVKVLVEGQTSTITKLEATIVRLQAIVDAGITDAQVQTVLDELNVIKDDVTSTIPDVVALPPAPVDPTPVEPAPVPTPIPVPVPEVAPPVIVEPTAPISAVDPNAPVGGEVVPSA